MSNKIINSLNLEHIYGFVYACTHKDRDMNILKRINDNS